jgi:hypothetical protein
MTTDLLLFKDQKVLLFFNKSSKILISLKFPLCLTLNPNLKEMSILSQDLDTQVKTVLKLQELDLR